MDILTLVLVFAFLWYLVNVIWFIWLTRRNWSLETWFLRSVSISIFLSPLLFFADFSTLSVENIAYIFLIWLIWAAWIIIHYETYNYLPAWISKAIISTYNIFILLLWYLVYDEKLSVYWYIWASIILVSWICISLVKSQHPHLNKSFAYWIFLSFMRAITMAIWVFWFAYFSREADVKAVSFMSEFTVFVWMLPFFMYRYIKKWNTYKSISKDDFLKIWLFSVWSAIWSFCVFYAMTLTKVWYVTLLLATTNIFVWLFWHFFFNEKLYKIQWFLIFTTVIWLVFLSFDKIS